MGCTPNRVRLALLAQILLLITSSFLSHDTLSLKATGRPCYDLRTASSARGYPSTR